MSRTNHKLALLAMLLLAWASGRAPAQDGPSCPIPGDGGTLTGPAPFCPEAWYTVPDNCPYPKLLYDSPRQPFYAYVDGIAFTRAQAGTQEFAARRLPKRVVLTDQDLDYEFQGGVRTLIGQRFAERFAFEASWFGLLNWDESKAVRDVHLNSQGTDGDLMSPFSNFGTPAIVGLDFNTFVSIRNISNMYNVELNVRQTLELDPSIMGMSLLYGFRYINIDERFEYRTESNSPAPAGAQNAVDVETGNKLFGFQLGTMVEFRVDEDCWLNFEFKAGICQNNAVQNSSYTTGPLAGPTTTTSGGVGDDKTTWLLDGALSYEYRITPAWVFRAGYQAVWIDGLALGSENFNNDVNILLLGPPQLVADGSVVYHGPFAGLMATF